MEFNLESSCQKVRIVAWRIATDSLPTKENKRRRTLEIDGICNICGIEKEDAHHVVVNCTKARALREKIRELWALPKESVLAEPNPVGY